MHLPIEIRSHNTGSSFGSTADSASSKLFIRAKSSISSGARAVGTPRSSGSGRIGGGIIAAVVIGVAAALVLMVVVCICWRSRSKESKARSRDLLRRAKQSDKDRAQGRSHGRIWRYRAGGGDDNNDNDKSEQQQHPRPSHATERTLVGQQGSDDLPSYTSKPCYDDEAGVGGPRQDNGVSVTEPKLAHMVR